MDTNPHEKPYNHQRLLWGELRERGLDGLKIANLTGTYNHKIN